jgi:hypothetical protein
MKGGRHPWNQLASRNRTGYRYADTSPSLLIVTRMRRYQPAVPMCGVSISTCRRTRCPPTRMRNAALSFRAPGTVWAVVACLFSRIHRAKPLSTDELSNNASNRRSRITQRHRRAIQRGRTDHRRPAGIAKVRLPKGLCWFSAARELGDATVSVHGVQEFGENDSAIADRPSRAQSVTDSP